MVHGTDKEKRLTSEGYAEPCHIMKLDTQAKFTNSMSEDKYPISRQGSDMK